MALEALGTPTRMTAIGETLRRERLRRNLDLQNVSRELKISSKMLEAIEDEKFDRLPGGVFAKAFVRQYARLLGLDEEEMAAEVQRILQPAAEVPAHGEDGHPSVESIPLPKVEAWQSVGERRFQWGSTLPALALVIVVMMGCAGIYSWWQHARHSTPARTTVVTAAPPVAPAIQPPAQAAAAQPQPTPVAESPAPQPVAQQPAAEPPANKPAQPENTAARANPEAQPSNPEGAPKGEANAVFGSGPVKVEVLANEAVWVMARADGKYLFSGTLDANQTRTVEANSTILLRIGNAGGVSITLNGKSIGSLGPKGQVRTIQLTSGGFEIVAAPKPSGAPLDDPLL